MTEAQSKMEEGILTTIAIEDMLDNGIRAAGKLSRASRERGFHVSGLTYDCERNTQYSTMNENAENPKEENLENEGLYRTWIGTQLHATPLSPKHEWGVYKVFDVNGRKVKVLGHIDEILECEDGSEIIVDKKFVAAIPRTPNQHYMRQISYYAALYSQQTGARVTRGALLYFTPYMKPEPGVERKKVFLFPVDVNAAMAELEAKVVRIQKAIDSNEMLPRDVGWLCQYCRWREPCIAKDGPITFRGVTYDK